MGVEVLPRLLGGEGEREGEGGRGRERAKEREGERGRAERGEIRKSGPPRWRSRPSPTFQPLLRLSTLARRKAHRLASMIRDILVTRTHGRMLLFHHLGPSIKFMQRV